MPDRLSRRGRRDLAILLLLGAGGLRRSEVCALRYEDLEPLRRRASLTRRAAIAERPIDRGGWVAHVRHAKRARAVDLSAATLDALRAWTQARPHCDSDHVFVSLARNRSPGPLSPRALNTLVAAYAAKAGLPADRRSPHVLRHTFCSLRRPRPRPRGDRRTRRPRRPPNHQGLRPRVRPAPRRRRARHLQRWIAPRSSAP